MPHPPVATPRRVVHCADALAWLPAQGVIAGASFVTSLPDVSELPGAAGGDYPGWMRRAARLVIEACPEDGVALFHQTDVISDGAWIDKAHHVTTAAEAAGARLLLHAIVCRHPAGTATFGRPGYSHLVGFTRGRISTRGVPRIDVLPDAGAMGWSKAIGLRACDQAVRFVRAHTATRAIVDPFCGRGTVLAVANAHGLDAVGVELGRRRAQEARTLRVELP